MSSELERLIDEDIALIDALMETDDSVTRVKILEVMRDVVQQIQILANREVNNAHSLSHFES